MSLSKDQGMVKIDGDSTTAVKALENVTKAAKDTAEKTTTLNGTLTTLVTKYGGAALATGAVTSALMVGKAAFDQFQQAQKDSANLFSQFGERGWEAAAAVNRITDAADNMIKATTAASSFNQLVNSDLAMTEETLQNLAKMAVDLGRKFNRSADDMLTEVSAAIAGGELGALRRYGIILDESEANLQANKKAMAEYGRVASETEKKNAKAALIAAEVDKRYQDVLISAGDVNEIEARYSNTKQKNMALVAKTMENTAKTIQSVKFAFADAKQEVMGFVNGLDHLDDKALTALRAGLEKAAWEASETIQENLGKNLTDQSWAGIRNAMEQDAKSLTNTLDTYRKHRTITTSEEAQQLQGMIKDREIMAGHAESEVQAIQQAIRLQKANLKEQGSAVTVQMRERRKLINEEIFGLQKTLEEATKRRDMQNEILAKQKELVTDYSLTESMTATDSMLQTLYNYGKESAAQLKVQQALADNFVGTIQKKGRIEEGDKKLAAERIKLLSQEWQTKERAIQNLELEIETTEDLVKKKKKIGIEDRARLERNKELLKDLKAEQTEMTSLIGILQNIMNGIFKRQPAATAPTGLAPAWAAEYQRILEVIKQGNDDARAAIAREFGTLNAKGIQQVLRDKNNAVIQLEKKYQEETRKLEEETYKARVEADKAELEEYEKTLSEYQAIRSKQYDEEKASVDKLYGLKRDQLTEQKSESEIEKDDYKSRLRVAQEHYAKLEALAKTRLDQMRTIQSTVMADQNRSLEQEKKVASDVEAAESEVNRIRKEKAKEAASIEKAKQDELKRIRDAAKQQIISWGEDVLKSTASSLYDATMMSNDALKESSMSRGEIFRKDLKAKAAALGKEALLEAGMEGARGIAAAAMGNPKAAGHFAAALAFAGIAGTSLAVSKAISAPSDAEIARRKEARSAEATGSGEAASVSGTSSGQSVMKVANFYFSSGFVMGTPDQVVKEFRRLEGEAEKRGQL